MSKAGRLALSSRFKKFSRPLPRIVLCSYIKVESSAKFNVFKVSLWCVANFETFVKFFLCLIPSESTEKTVAEIVGSSTRLSFIISSNCMVALNIKNSCSAEV